MNKAMIAAGAFILLVGAASAAFFMMRDDASPQAGDEQPSVVEQSQEESGIAQWIEGLAAGKSMVCEYRVTGGDAQETSVKMYAERDRYRTEVETPQGTYISISDGKTIYSFLEGSKQGMKMDMDCMKDLADDLPKTGDAPVQEQYAAPEEAIGNIPGISCREADSVDVSVPSVIVFTDQCAMLKQQTEMMKQYQEQMPELPEDVKNMMGQ